jgi:hypothetical protein
MMRPVIVALTGFALVGCVGPRGGHYVGGEFASAMFPASADTADHVCREELPNDVIYPASWPEAHGMSAEQQRARYYQKCMEIMGQHGASLDKTAPSPTSEASATSPASPQ